MILLLFSSLRLQALDSSVFKENYPDFNVYQTLLFSQLRIYTIQLFKNSIISNTSSGSRVYKVREKTKDGFVIIHSTIEREISEGQIIERISYIFENGNSLRYEVIKKGKNIIQSEDLDLLMFFFKRGNAEFYQITCFTFNLQLTFNRLADHELSTFNLGFMGVHIQIESYFHEFEASQNYFYFFDKMSYPQFSLKVLAIKSPGDWGGITYTHTGSDWGEVSPSLFFQGLNGASGVFVGAASEISQTSMKLGFPQFK
jgi:hypothetical protein